MLHLCHVLTSLLFLLEYSLLTTLTLCRTSQSENELRLLREKQHRARLNTVKHPKISALNREHMWFRSILSIRVID